MFRSTNRPLYLFVYSDFNNGHIMEWSLENETYCDYWSNYGGAYKAPEEFIEDSYSNEGVDTWALGHGIFGLLTGLFPYYRTFSHSTIRKMVAEGRKPYVDDRYRTRSVAEGRLVEIMEQCWEFYAADRPSTYEVVVHIRETKRLFEEEQR
jgi:serine/threonine protein kinase